MKTVRYVHAVGCNPESLHDVARNIEIKIRVIRQQILEQKKEFSSDEEDLNRDSCDDNQEGPPPLGNHAQGVI